MFDTFQPEEKEEKTQLNGLCSTRLGFCSRMFECTMFNTLLRTG